MIKLQGSRSSDFPLRRLDHENQILAENYHSDSEEDLETNVLASSDQYSDSET